MFFVCRPGFFNTSITRLCNHAAWMYIVIQIMLRGMNIRCIYGKHDKISVNMMLSKWKNIIPIHFSSKAFALIISLDGLKIMSTILDCGPFKSRPVRGHLYGYYFYYYRCYYRTNPIFHSLEKHANTDFYILTICMFEYITQSFCNYLY